MREKKHRDYANEVNMPTPIHRQVVVLELTWKTLIKENNVHSCLHPIRG